MSIQINPNTTGNDASIFTISNLYDSNEVRLMLYKITSTTVRLSGYPYYKDFNIEELFPSMGYGFDAVTIAFGNHLNGYPNIIVTSNTAIVYQGYMSSGGPIAYRNIQDYTVTIGKHPTRSTGFIGEMKAFFSGVSFYPGVCK